MHRPTPFKHTSERLMRKTCKWALIIDKQMRFLVLSQEINDVVSREITRCEVLLESEPDRSKCKWPILTMARLLELCSMLDSGEGALDQLHPCTAQPAVVQICTALTACMSRTSSMWELCYVQHHN